MIEESADYNFQAKDGTYYNHMTLQTNKSSGMNR